MYILFLVILFTPAISSLAPLPDYSIQEGQRRYNELVSQSPLYGPCWTEALSALEQKCTQMNEEIHQKLALSFTNCFLESSGLQKFDCSGDSSFSSCVKFRPMDDRTFNTYRTFFAHTQSICHYLSNEIWQARAEETVNSLSSASREALEAMSAIKSFQKQSLDDMSNQMKSSKNALETLQSTLSEQNSIELDILQGYREIQRFILVEINKFYSVFFYLSTVVAIYFCTTPRRTQEARLVMYVLLMINLYLERKLVSLTYSSETHVLAKYLRAEDTMENVWACRLMFATIGTCVLIYHWFTFKDYNIFNYQLLNSLSWEIQRLTALVADVKAIQLQTSPESPRSNAICRATCPKPPKLYEMSSDESGHDFKPSDDSDFESDVGLSEDEARNEDEMMPDDTVDYEGRGKSTRVSFASKPGPKSPFLARPGPPVASPAVSTPKAKGRAVRTPISPAKAPPSAASGEEVKSEDQEDESPSKVSKAYSLRPRSRQAKDTSLAFFSSDEE